jgi:hypothetical protein
MPQFCRNHEGYGAEVWKYAVEDVELQKIADPNYRITTAVLPIKDDNDNLCAQGQAEGRSDQGLQLRKLRASRSQGNALCAGAARRLESDLGKNESGSFSVELAGPPSIQVMTIMSYPRMCF